MHASAADDCFRFCNAVGVGSFCGNWSIKTQTSGFFFRGFNLSKHRADGAPTLPLAKSAPGPVVVRRVNERLEIDDEGISLIAAAHLMPGSAATVVEIVDGSIEEGKFVALFGRAGRLRAAMAIGRPRRLMGYRPLLESGSSWDDALAHEST